MNHRFFLSIFPLIFIFACSIEDPDTDPPDPKGEEPDPVEQQDTQPPSVPEELRVSEKSFESLTLTWKASTDNDKVAKYQVFLDASKVAEVTTATSILSGLSPGNSYSLSVAAIDASGNSSERSSELRADTPIDTEAPGVPEDLSVTATTETTVTITWTASTDNAEVLEYAIFLNGELYATAVNPELTLENLQQGEAYSVKILSRDIYGNNSPLSESLDFTLETTGEEPPENSRTLIFISEYIEGSSNNKALELANVSETEIDLSAYSFKKISNENEDWSDEKKLEGKLPAGEVFVLAHSKADPLILQQSDFHMGGGFLDFNGNDPVGLFKDGELIDMIGTPGGEYFAQDVTMRRKASVQTPSATFKPEEWEILEKDVFDGIGKL